MSSSSSLNLSDTIRRVADSVGYPTLKPEQEKAIVSFVSGNNIFMSLPTGHYVLDCCPVCLMCCRECKGRV